MQYQTIFRVIGVLLMLFSVSMIPPFFIDAIYRDGAGNAFILGFFATFGTGFLMWNRFRKFYQHLKTRDGFVVVVLFWMVLSLFGALPLYIAHHPFDSFTNAMFEAVSGLTTTGATVYSGIEFLPHAIQFYRQELQFLGGMGIIVLAVAVLPMLGIGGMQLYRAETPGPMKDSKLTPRITETAKALWYIYLTLTLACALCYWLAGMNTFDAVSESFSTVSTGGFSTHDASFGFYHSKSIDLIACFFMFLGGVNFALHFLVLQRHKLVSYWEDIEFRTYYYIVFTTSFIAIVVLWWTQQYPTFSEAIVHGLFTVISLITTTGLSSTSLGHWPMALIMTIYLIAIIGACGGSTSGGVKVMRFILLCKQSMREMRRLVHPKAVYSIKFGRQTLPEHTVEAMWGFIAIFIAVFVIVLLLLLASGLDMPSALTADVATLANVGAGVGSVAHNFEHLTGFAKWVCIFAMLAGRLEIFTLLVLFTPAFWRR
tara:strand:+ start:85935 stop:87386 length:1452 start_codon:yes stop_codon:yes gene_type:complete